MSCQLRRLLFLSHLNKKKKRKEEKREIESEERKIHTQKDSKGTRDRKRESERKKEPFVWYWGSSAPMDWHSKSQSHAWLQKWAAFFMFTKYIFFSIPSLIALFIPIQMHLAFAWSPRRWWRFPPTLALLIPAVKKSNRFKTNWCTL